jgi:hypothetical protein
MDPSDHLKKASRLSSMLITTHGQYGRHANVPNQEPEVTDGFGLLTDRKELAHNVLVSEDNV